MPARRADRTCPGSLKSSLLQSTRSLRAFQVECDCTLQTDAWARTASALEVGEPTLERADGGIGEATVNVAHFGKVEELCAMVCIAEDKGRRHMNRRVTRAGSIFHGGACCARRRKHSVTRTPHLHSKYLRLKEKGKASHQHGLRVSRIP